MTLFCIGIIPIFREDVPWQGKRLCEMDRLRLFLNILYLQNYHVKYEQVHTINITSNSNMYHSFTNFFPAYFFQVPLTRSRTDFFGFFLFIGVCFY